MASKTLLKGGTVLTLGAKTPNFTEADVLIDDGRVAEVGQGLRARDAEMVDASDAIVMPGFVDTHRHVWKSLFRNLGDTAVLGSHYQPDDIYAATLIGLLGAIEAGITTVVDWADINSGEDYANAALQAHADAGLRTVFVHTASPLADSLGEVEPPLRRLISGHPESAETSTTIAFGPDNPGRSDLDRLAGQWALASGAGLRIHAHVGLEASEAGIVSGLAQQDLLGGHVTLVHAAHLNDVDLDAISSSGTSVVLTPSTEMAGGLGMPSLQKLLDRNIRPGLGIDDEGVVPGDMFAQMRATNSVQHAAYFDLKLAGKAGLPNLLTTRDVIRYATIDGARAVGLGDVTGSLEAGKRADIILLRTDRPNIFPDQRSGGEVLHVDWPALRRVVAESREYVVDKSGFKLPKI